MKKAMALLMAAALAACIPTAEAAVGSSDWFFVDTTDKASSAEVVINFKKEASELDQSCASAYWMCYDEGGRTSSFGVQSGEAWLMAVGTYTLEFNSGEAAFANPEPIQIVVDGTQSRIEREVVISRKMIRFNCVFYNNQLDPQAGIQPSSLGLDSYCKWRLGSGEWHTNGEIVDVPTGPWNLEIDIDERIGLMAWADIIQKPILLDGTSSSHTEYINVVGEKSAKAIFRFLGHSSKPISPVFDESRVYITLRSAYGAMIVRAGESYFLRRGSYHASFEYRAPDGNEIWREPDDMLFEINGTDKSFTLNFIDMDDAIYRKFVRIWFDANGGTVNTPLLSYALLQSDGSRTMLNHVPIPEKVGASFMGWYSSKSSAQGERKFQEGYFVPIPDEPGIEYTTISGENEEIDGKLAIHLYARWRANNTNGMTQDWLDRHLTIASASNGDIATAAAMTAANGCRTVGECYALGIDPEDPFDDLRITAFRKEDGQPVITVNHTVDGSGNSFADRIRTLGKKSLTDAEWVDVTDTDQSEYHFFKVAVELDDGGSGGNGDDINLDDFVIEQDVLQGYIGKASDVVIPSSVTSIGSYAFAGGTNLVSVTIPDCVTNVGAGAFAYCSGLESVVFEGNAPSVGEDAFDGVSGCAVYVKSGSSGWGVAIPGTWNGLPIRYKESEE